MILRNLQKINPSDQGKLKTPEVYRATSALLIVLFYAAQLFKEKPNHDFLFQFFKLGDAGVDFLF
jgi:hypothetical protein